MKQAGVWMLTVLALSLATTARGEELACEFIGGTRSVVRLDEEARAWGRTASVQQASEFLGTRPGASFWFMRARVMAGSSQGALAGTFTPPATDFWAAAVHRRPSQLMLVEVVSDSIRVLAVSTVRGRDGRFAATYSNQSGGPSSLLAEQFTGSCQMAGTREAP